MLSAKHLPSQKTFSNRQGTNKGWDNGTKYEMARVKLQAFIFRIARVHSSRKSIDSETENVRKSRNQDDCRWRNRKGQKIQLITQIWLDKNRVMFQSESPGRECLGQRDTWWEKCDSETENVRKSRNQDDCRWRNRKGQRIQLITQSWLDKNRVMLQSESPGRECLGQRDTWWEKCDAWWQQWI